jgi:hypothetical protein
VYCQTYPRSTIVSIRYEAATRTVYEATFFGLGILDPATGSRRLVLMNPENEGSFEFNHVQQPCFAGGRLFVMNGEGRVVALRHP